MFYSFVWLNTIISIVYSYKIPVIPYGDIQPGSLIESIIGGQPASIDQAPWQAWFVAHEYERIEFGICGAALINKRAALTAAHCCSGLSNTSSFGVKYGGIDRTNLEFERNVTHIVRNPKFTFETFDGDWCVLILDRDIEETRHVKLIEIADKVPRPGSRADLTGWGVTDWHNRTGPHELQHGQLTIIGHDDCAQKWNRSINGHKTFEITNNMVCADSKTVSACYLDSGSPLVVDKKLVGIVSFGDSNCPADSTDWPNFYGNAVVAKQWIFEQIYKYFK